VSTALSLLAGTLHNALTTTRSQHCHACAPSCFPGVHQCGGRCIRCLPDVSTGKDRKMTDRRDWGQPPQYPPQGYGRQWPQEPPWQAQPYDPQAHQQRIGAPQPPFPPHGQPWPQPGYGQPPFPPQQPGYQPGPPPRRRSWPARHKVLTGLIAFASLVIIGGIANAAGGNKANTAANAPATASPAAAAHPSSAARPKPSAAGKATPKAEAACEKRAFASGDIYVRMLSPGTQWTAQQLGGEWGWNATLGKCLTSVQMMIATAPTVAGSCTQVGYVADNPGYDPNAAVAAPLMRVVAQAGPACPAAAPSTTAQPTPTAAPVTAASTAPASCYPLTNGGNCYEPGEYCRTADHGVSGVAGDGEAIICEDNDGWRWEAA
jgi:hypothetical protein